MTQAELIDGVLKALHLPSDYALGKTWGIPKQTLWSYRSGRRPFDVYMATRVAETLDKRPAEIVAMVELAKEPSGERRRYWEEMLKKPAGVVSVSGCIIALAYLCTLATPCPVSASTGEDPIALDRTINYTKLRRLKRALARFCQLPSYPRTLHPA